MFSVYDTESESLEKMDAGLITLQTLLSNYGMPSNRGTNHVKNHLKGDAYTFIRKTWKKEAW